MKRIGPALLSVVLAFILLMAPRMEFPALGQTEYIGTATPSDAEPEKTETEAETDIPETEVPETDFNRTDDTKENDIHDMDMDIINEVDKRTVPYLTATGSDASLEVTAVVAAGSNEVLAVELDGAKEALSHLLSLDSYRNYAFAIVKLSDRSQAFYPIRYDLDTLSQAGPGFTLVPGFIETPEELSLPAELNTEVLLPVLLYDPDSPCEIPAVDFTLYPDYILLRESDTEETLLQSSLINQAVWFDFEGGYSWGADMAWDISSVQFGIPGTYTANASLALKGLTLPDSLSPVSADVFVQDDGKFMLGPPEFQSARMDVCWTKETPDISLLCGYYAIGDGEWQEDTEGDLINLEDDYMYVYYFDVEYFNIPYHFRLSYDGQDSNILKVYMSEDRMYYDFYDGDRDGGDREEQDTPAVGQPAPTEASAEASEPAKPETSAPGISTPETSAPDEPLLSDDSSGDSGSQSSGGHSSSDYSSSDHSSSDHSSSGHSSSSHSSSGHSSGTHSSGGGRPTGQSGFIADGPGTAASETEAEPVPSSVSIEEETDNSVALSGTRIKKFLEFNPGQPLTVTKHRIRLSIPANSSLFSDMESQTLFRVELLTLSGDTFSVELSMDGIPLTDVPPLTLTVPRETSGEDWIFSLAGADGTVLDESRVQDGFLTFTVTQTGTFTIRKSPFPANTPTDSAVTAEPPGSGEPTISEDPERFDETDGSRSDTPVLAPQEPSAPPETPWVPGLCAVLVLALSGLYFLRRSKRGHGKKGDDTQ